MLFDIKHVTMGRIWQKPCFLLYFWSGLVYILVLVQILNALSKMVWTLTQNPWTGTKCQTYSERLNTNRHTHISRSFLPCKNTFSSLSDMSSILSLIVSLSVCDILPTISWLYFSCILKSIHLKHKQHFANIISIIPFNNTFLYLP